MAHQGQSLKKVLRASPREPKVCGGSHLAEQSLWIPHLRGSMNDYLRYRYLKKSSERGKDFLDAG